MSETFALQPAKIILPPDTLPIKAISFTIPLHSLTIQAVNKGTQYGSISHMFDNFTL